MPSHHLHTPDSSGDSDLEKQSCQPNYDLNNPPEVYEEPNEELNERYSGEHQQGRDPHLQKWNTATSASSGGKTMIGFAPHDPGNPYNWSRAKKVSICVVGILTVLNSTLGSAIPSGAISQLAQHFHLTDEAKFVLPNSIYLVGYVVGPLLFAPLSESYGRQIITLGTFAGFTIFTLATCFSPNFASFIVFRLFIGVFASSPISVTGGQFADLYNTPIARGRSMALFMTATTWGPLVAPIASGYLAPYSWRWPFWFALIFAGVSWFPLLILPETYAPVILQRRAQKIRKRDPDADVWAQIELDRTTFRDLLVKFLGRPFRMLFGEAVVGFSVLYLSLMYAIFYLFFQAFPLIYPVIYGFNSGETGLSFLGIGVGALFSCAIYLWWDDRLIKAKAADKHWVNSEEYRRLPLACIGGPFFMVSLFWLGWAARPSVHWIGPILSGIPFGIGFVLIFMALINYMVDAYEIYAASALAAASCARSVFGAVLPFAGQPMYRTLGIGWASSLLGFISLALCVIPYAFIKYGDRIRANSKFCQELAAIRQKREEAEAKRLRKEAKKERRALKVQEAV